MEDWAPAIAIAAVLGFVWGLKYLQMKKRQQERDMLHRERMLAMEKGIPLPEIPTVEENGVPLITKYPNLLPNLALGCGILLWFAGFGVIVALLVSPIRDAHEGWSFGFIPIMVGLGCLIYYWLLRRSQRR